MVIKQIGIVVPAYNEGKRIEETISKLPEKFSIDNTIYKVVKIVVNDGSSDETSKFAYKVPGTTVIDHLLNLGAGGATRTGVNYATRIGCQYVITMDADGQHLVEDVIRVAQESITQGYEFAIGTRLVDAKGMPMHKQVGNFGLSFLTWGIIGVKTTDSQSGLRFFTAKAARAISWRSDNFGFCSEMLISARRHKFKVDEVSIQAVYDDYSKAKGQSSWNAVNILKTLLSAKLRSMIYE